MRRLSAAPITRRLMVRGGGLRGVRTVRRWLHRMPPTTSSATLRGDAHVGTHGPAPRIPVRFLVTRTLPVAKDPASTPQPSDKGSDTAATPEAPPAATFVSSDGIEDTETPKRQMEPLEYLIYGIILAVAGGVLFWVWNKQRWKVFEETVTVLKETESVREWFGGEPIRYWMPSDEELDVQGLRMEARWSEESPARRLDYYQVEFWAEGPSGGKAIVTVVMRRMPKATNREFHVQHVSLWKCDTRDRIVVRDEDYVRRFSLLPGGEPVSEAADLPIIRSVWYPDHRRR